MISREGVKEWSEPRPESGWEFYRCSNCRTVMCGRCDEHVRWNPTLQVWQHAAPCRPKETHDHEAVASLVKKAT